MVSVFGEVSLLDIKQTTLLESSNLKTDFHTDDGFVKVVGGVDFMVFPALPAGD
jgi:hypothetical protein